MADVDEDAFPSAPAHQSGPNDQDDDGDDETQDFRMLASLTGNKTAQGAVLKRGTKDFEPNPTQHQANILDESRQAMQDALSVVRSQSAKNHNVGQFVDDRSEGHEWDLKLREGLNGQDWDDRCVVVYKMKSTFGRTIGRADSRSWTWLLPEEALFLLERGSLDIRWPDVNEKRDSNSEAETDIQVNDENTRCEEPLGDLPMSLQGAYATFAGRAGLNMDRWLVYSGLRRLGYIVHRAPSWHAYDENTGNGHVGHTTADHATNYLPPLSQPPSLLARLLRFISNPRLGSSCPSHGPLLAPGLHRSYVDIFRSLSLVPYHTIPARTSDTNPPPPPAPSPTGQFTIAYHIWRPSNSTFKKSLPPPPDFRICVLDARATLVPSMSEIGALLDTMPPDELPAEKKVEMRIKHGRRNVILAVVDVGVVSYLRVGEAEIGGYNVYEGKVGRGSKGRGRGGGGGRGGRGGARGGGNGRGRGK